MVCFFTRKFCYHLTAKQIDWQRRKVPAFFYDLPCSAQIWRRIFLTMGLHNSLASVWSVSHSPLSGQEGFMWNLKLLLGKKRLEMMCLYSPEGRVIMFVSRRWWETKFDCVLVPFSWLPLIPQICSLIFRGWFEAFGPRTFQPQLMSWLWVLSWAWSLVSAEFHSKIPLENFYSDNCFS